EAPRVLASIAEARYLRGGDELYREGDLSEHVYLVVSGRLRVTSNGSLVGYVGRLEPVGEMGVVTGEPRTSTVRAVRDTVVLGVAHTEFLDFLDRHPGALLALSR